jgi:oligopeptide/dipeptide ABC transporter ATP-binding protein
LSDLLVVKDLQKFFPIRTGMFGKKHFLHAVDQVSLTIKEGECFGLVGESGCGKSTLSRTIMKTYSPTGGTISFSNMDLFQMDKAEEKKCRKDIQMVFQDPYWSVNPKMRVGSIIEEPIVTHLKVTRQEREAQVKLLLQEVGLSEEFYYRYPHQLSGGQRQRVGIARAIALNPKLIILDEPTSALDMSVQAQILNLLKKLQQSKGFTYLFISHDLSVIKHMCSKIAVMYLGEIVEMGNAEEIFDSPKHPYTRLLFKSLPTLNQEDFELAMFNGEMPKAVEPPDGCRFASRCKFAVDSCTVKQDLMPMNSRSTHLVRCHLAQELAR